MRSLVYAIVLSACVEAIPEPDQLATDQLATTGTADDIDSAPVQIAEVCTTGEIRCDAFVRTTPAGGIHAFAAPQGLNPTDLASAYSIPAPRGTPTIAIVDAYGYPNVETDLATYRAQFNLPACTRANGCLTVLNDDGNTSPLPAAPPATDDWTIETALDIQMASAVCPACKILLVQATKPDVSLFKAQNAAAAHGATVISNSWGAPENATFVAHEPDLNHPGIAIFVSAGDKGYNEGGGGPHYPSVSSHVISVGGTRLVRDASSPRGWHEVAWSLINGSGGGSSCSATIAKPAYQANVPCAFKAATDISAVGDPATGLAIYNAANGGWLIVGGTSAAAPIVASIFAVAGHGADASSGAFVAQHTSVLYDITTGNNGNCGSTICNAGLGWDGPTGYGTPNASLLAKGDAPTLTITAPAPNAHVQPDFNITTDVTDAVSVTFTLDNHAMVTVSDPPFNANVTDATPGPHVISVTATAVTGATKHQTVSIVVDEPMDGGSGSGAAPPDDASGGCAASHSGSMWVGLVIALALARRRRV